VKLLQWDTDFFGFAIGSSDLLDASLRDEIALARGEGIACLYLFVPASRLDLVNDCMREGARIVDLKVTLDRPGDIATDWDRGSVRLANGVDLAACEGPVVVLSQESRFRADPRFPDERICEMYRAWFRRCQIEGFVVAPSDGSQGFVAVRVEDGTVSIDLVYVGPDARGRGLAARLVAAALQHASGASGVVATQAGNVAAQRLYQGLGFRSRSVQVVLHLWLDEVP
jgi:ribosomal protein S18 acetylase RimI-like enzyme